MAGIRHGSFRLRVSRKPIACSPPPRGRSTPSGTSPVTSARQALLKCSRSRPWFTACRLTIRLRATATGSDAEISYTHTSLGPSGDAFVAAFSEDFYRQFMQDWESRLNHFLAHGTALKVAGDSNPA